MFVFWENWEQDNLLTCSGPNYSNLLMKQCRKNLQCKKTVTAILLEFSYIFCQIAYSAALYQRPYLMMVIQQMGGRLRQSNNWSTEAWIINWRWVNQFQPLCCCQIWADWTFGLADTHRDFSQMAILKLKKSFSSRKTC